MEEIKDNNFKDGDICPACGSEFEAGEFKRCGGSIMTEVKELREKCIGLNKEICRLVAAIRNLERQLEVIE